MFRHSFVVQLIAVKGSDARLGGRSIDVQVPIDLPMFPPLPSIGCNLGILTWQ